MNKVLMAIAISATLVAIPASASPYIGAGLGSARTDGNHTGSKVFAGYQFNENVGAQVAYNDFGNYRGSTATAWSAAVVGTMPIDAFWDVSAKVGATENRTTLAGSGRKSELLWGIGAGYNFNRNVALRFEYEDFGKMPTDAAGNRWNATNWAMNVKYSF